MNPVKYVISIISAAVLLSPMIINADEELPEVPHECQWTQTVTAEPSCTEPGAGIQVCEGCGTEEEYEIPALEHSYGDPVISGSCTEPATETFVCTVCGDTKVIEISAAPGHLWGSWTENTRFCDEEGEKVRVCTVCGETETEIIPAGEHGWGGWNEHLVPTCTEEGSEKRVCIDCGDVEFRAVAPLGHRWGEWNIITDPSCTEEGERTHACTKCPETANEAIPALGHTWSEWSTVKEPTYLDEGEKNRSCTVCAIPESAPIEKLANPFTDVKSEKWYTTPILFCLQNEYMVGVSDSVFSLSQPVTRAMIVQIMAKISGADLDAAEYQTCSFVDIADGKWYTSAVAWANKNGLASGIGQGHFGYKNSITREELALFLMKLTEYNGYGTAQRGALPGSYKDLDRVHSWAYDAIDWALTTGVMHGSTPNHISPRIPLTRAQVAEIVYDYCKAIVPLD